MKNIKKFDPETQKKFPKRYTILTIVGLFTLTIIEIYASNTVVAYSEKYEKLSVLEKNLRMENKILENEIAKNSSLISIASKSAQLGFSNSLSVEYIR